MHKDSLYLLDGVLPMDDFAGIFNINGSLVS